MNPTPHNQEHIDSLFVYALRSTPSDELAAVEATIAACPVCQQELKTLRPVVRAFVSWPTDVLRPPVSLWERVSERIGTETRPQRFATPVKPLPTLQWEKAAPGISVKMLSSDAAQNRVSMLVRLEPGTDYPAHEHADVEELYLLDGELMIDDKKLYPGEYIRAEAGTVDHRVWSETGCTCVLLTSAGDILL